MTIVVDKIFGLTPVNANSRLMTVTTCLVLEFLRRDRSPLNSHPTSFKNRSYRVRYVNQVV